MSIILQGIDLPKGGDTINITIDSDGQAYPLDVWPTEEDIHRAIQIPKKHGRLIDAKLLADTINKAIQDGTFTSKSIWEWIGDAPTILEGEE